MATDYEYIEKAFRDYFPMIKDSIGKHSDMVMDHSRIWEGIEEIDLEFYDDTLEVIINMSGTFLEYPILDVDHQMMGQSAVWPWIEKSFLTLFNIKPLKNFKKVKLTYIDSEGDIDYSFIKFR
jgi:hypothetical protein